MIISPLKEAGTKYRARRARGILSLILVYKNRLILRSRAAKVIEKKKEWIGKTTEPSGFVLMSF